MKSKTPLTACSSGITASNQEELDFIINYDIKYRMGKELDAYINGTLPTAPSENEEEDSE